ncbi:MAG: peptide ABC transporter permease [Spirochaetae bacterium HGW-Spirochaetae-5]|nr:MAG: peptide ABC transporter permease [Spirochaetae bacterium HGW-Spirochaetae-5]
MIKINPLTINKFRRFRSIKRGYYSCIILAVFILISLAGELLVNSRALVVRYNGEYYFPTYGSIIPGKSFGLDYHYETNYRELKKVFENSGTGNFVILPPVPYNPYETEIKKDSYPPLPPSIKDRHYLGTDKTGRDVAARLLYGFRIAIFFSLILLVFQYAIGVTIGCFMGYLGGRFDLVFQRIIEIWNNIPFLYAIIIVSSIIIPSFLSLLGIMIFFGWIGITWYVRTATYREREREYVLAARALGASTSRIIMIHIIPNIISIIITFIPFSVAGGITALTALDFLGFGLAPPTPSWGQLLSEASEFNIKAPWIGASVITSMIAVLTMVTFIGEAVRESFDPKMFTTYE